MTTLRRTLPVVAWTLALTVAVRSLAAVGDGALAAPNLLDPGSWSAWLADRRADEAVMALVRLLALGLAWYLLVVTLLGLVLRAVRAGRLVRVADVVTVPFVRSMLQAGVGAGLTGLLVAVSLPGAALAGATEAARPPLVLVTPEAGASPPPVMQKLDDVPAPVPAPPPVSPDGHRTWTVASGEHLWSIADQVLTRAWGRSPSGAEVGGYWNRLVEANRASLADPENPDLIFTGQQLVVPAP